LATAQWQKEHGTYNVFDFREELEYGLTDNFQVSLYLNHHYVNARDSVPTEDPARPGRRLPGAYEPAAKTYTPATILRLLSTAIISNPSRSS